MKLEAFPRPCQSGLAAAVTGKRKPRGNEGEGPGACLRTGDARKERDANGEFDAREALVRYPNRLFSRAGHESPACRKHRLSDCSHLPALAADASHDLQVPLQLPSRATRVWPRRRACG